MLKPVVDTVINGNRSCEIDPTRLDKGEEVDANLAILDAYINYALDCIFSTCDDIPSRTHNVVARKGGVPARRPLIVGRVRRTAPDDRRRVQSQRRRARCPCRRFSATCEPMC